MCLPIKRLEGLGFNHALCESVCSCSAHKACASGFRLYCLTKVHAVYAAFVFSFLALGLEG